MDWLACKKSELIKEIKPDANLIKSLLSASSKKLESEALLPLNETTASSKVSLAYDSARELLEALATARGYKVYNHECFCAFLKEILKESSLADRFNALRKLRNAVNYYGKDISRDEAEKILEDIRRLIKEIKARFFAGGKL